MQGRTVPKLEEYCKIHARSLVLQRKNQTIYFSVKHPLPSNLFLGRTAAYMILQSKVSITSIFCFSVFVKTYTYYRICDQHLVHVQVLALLM